MTGMDKATWWRRVEPSFLVGRHVACYFGDDYTILFWITPGKKVVDDDDGS